mmetsp:Transcript_53130/g.113466  ORF Transcript_53130/g.113466 Transcript_53130/m.113466 type:complete len:683 (-) Transcript_53130:495-2543(-)
MPSKTSTTPLQMKEQDYKTVKTYLLKNLFGKVNTRDTIALQDFVHTFPRVWQTCSNPVEQQRLVKRVLDELNQEISKDYGLDFVLLRENDRQQGGGVVLTKRGLPFLQEWSEAGGSSHSTLAAALKNYKERAPDPPVPAPIPAQEHVFAAPPPSFPSYYPQFPGGFCYVPYYPYGVPMFPIAVGYPPRFEEQEETQQETHQETSGRSFAPEWAAGWVDVADEPNEEQQQEQQQEQQNQGEDQHPEKHEEGCDKKPHSHCQSSSSCSQAADSTTSTTFSSEASGSTPHDNSMSGGLTESHASDLEEKFSSSGRASSGDPGALRTSIDDQLLSKTKLCKFFSKGFCSRGHSCTFAHGSKELRTQPNLFRTELCFEFTSSGRCQHGQSCKYAHSEEELRMPLAAEEKDAVNLLQSASNDIDNADHCSAEANIVGLLGLLENGMFRDSTAADRVQAPAAEVPRAVANVKLSATNRPTVRVELDPVGLIQTAMQQIKDADHTSAEENIAGLLALFRRGMFRDSDVDRSDAADMAAASLSASAVPPPGNREQINQDPPKKEFSDLDEHCSIVLSVSTGLPAHVDFRVDAAHLEIELNHCMSLALVPHHLRDLDPEHPKRVRELRDLQHYVQVVDVVARGTTIMFQLSSADEMEYVLCHCSLMRCMELSREMFPYLCCVTSSLQRASQL